MQANEAIPNTDNRSSYKFQEGIKSLGKHLWMNIKEIPNQVAKHKFELLVSGFLLYAQHRLLCYAAPTSNQDWGAGDSGPSGSRLFKDKETNNPPVQIESSESVDSHEERTRNKWQAGSSGPWGWFG